MRRFGLPELLLLVAVATVALASRPARAESGPDLLKRAHDTFEYGDFTRTVTLLREVPDQVDLSESERIEAWRMLGLSYFYLHDKAAAEHAMFELLKQDPDYQLDPFYVPPDAVAFFDEVRRRNEPYLAPIRDRRKQAAQKAKERAEQAEAKPASMPAEVLEHRVERASSLVAWMPFGLGQFQNGSPKLGAVFLSSEVASALVSVGSYLLVEALRSSETGRFSEANYGLAERAATVKWVSGIAFYALWLAGAVQANVAFVPSRDLGISSRPPSAAPDGPLAIPVSATPTHADSIVVPPSITPVPKPAATPTPSIAPARAPVTPKATNDSPESTAPAVAHQ